MEEIEATDSGLEEDGIVNDRTIDLGRLPCRSSTDEGYKTKQK